MSETEGTTRRTFLKNAGALAGASLVTGLPGCAHLGLRGPRASDARRGLGTISPDRLRVAYIGTGGIGNYHLESTVELGVACPCYCDVDTKRMKLAAESFPKAVAYQDYREMFDKEHKHFDAVMIGTPDHHHYYATMIAMQLGKHVYTQKPLTHTVWEARQLVQAARKYKVATQMGNQGHAAEGWRLVYEWIHSGATGDVKEVHTWTDRPVWPQGMQRPEDEDRVPSHLNWDAWLGPAPERPYKVDKYHPFAWRGWWDFGAGALGDMACHTMDAMFGALDPGHPTSIEPLALTPMNGETFPTASIVKWEFPPNQKRPGFTAFWYDGGLRPPFPPELEAGRRISTTGSLFFCTKASILVQGDYCDSPRIIPESRMKEIGKPPRMLERSPGHVAEWVMAAKGEKPIGFAKSNFDYAGPFCEAVLLGNVALRVGRRLEWDGPNLTIINLPEANRWITKEYRAGWRV